MHFVQVPPVKIEHSDKPEIAPLTLTHMLGPMVLHVLILALGTLVWLTELCVCSVQQKKMNQVIHPMQEFVLHPGGLQYNKAL